MFSIPGCMHMLTFATLVIIAHLQVDHSILQFQMQLWTNHLLLSQLLVPQLVVQP